MFNVINFVCLFFLLFDFCSQINQTIEKQTVDRMKRRHKNIHNEILMEKRVSVYDVQFTHYPPLSLCSFCPLLLFCLFVVRTH